MFPNTKKMSRLNIFCIEKCPNPYAKTNRSPNPELECTLIPQRMDAYSYCVQFTTQRIPSPTHWVDCYHFNHSQTKHKCEVGSEWNAFLSCMNRWTINVLHKTHYIQQWQKKVVIYLNQKVNPALQHMFTLARLSLMPERLWVCAVVYDSARLLNNLRLSN